MSCAWVGCIAGALEENEYRSKLVAAGFEQIDVEPTRIYRAQDAREILLRAGHRHRSDCASSGWEVHERFRSGGEAQWCKSLLWSDMLQLRPGISFSLCSLHPDHEYR